jgi:hypothetical protein
MPIQFQLMIEANNQSLLGAAHNISARGLYFVTKERLNIGVLIRVQLEIPRELTGKPQARYVYFAKVVRVTQTDDESQDYGIALKFICYHDLNSQSTRFHI